MTQIGFCTFIIANVQVNVNGFICLFVFVTRFGLCLSIARICQWVVCLFFLAFVSIIAISVKFITCLLFHCNPTKTKSERENLECETLNLLLRTLLGLTSHSHSIATFAPNFPFPSVKISFVYRPDNGNNVRVL